MRDIFWCSYQVEENYSIVCVIVLQILFLGGSQLKMFFLTTCELTQAQAQDNNVHYSFLIVFCPMEE